MAAWNDCTPTCVAGHWHHRAVTVYFSDLVDNRYQTVQFDPAFH